jgi:hypothetical protein
VQGANQLFAIVANAGYTISNVVVDGISQGAVASYTFTNVVANHTISASFSPIVVNYTITSSAGTGGSVTPTGAVSVVQGANQSFAIAASAGYTISNVVVDGISQGALASYTFTNVVANHTITASFSPIVVNYTITASAGTGGSITPTGAVSVVQGANQSFAIAASAGYTISNVVVDGISQGAVASYTFTNVVANHTISASFSPIVVNYTITASAGIGGSITPTGAVSVVQGANQSFAIAASAGYTISNVLVDGISQGAVASYTFTNVAANHTISASFSPIVVNYTITASAGNGGSITPTGAVSVVQGANQSFAIAANAGYKISAVTVDGISAGAVASYTFTNVRANHTIAAAFVPDINPCNLLSKYAVPRTTALPTLPNLAFSHSYTIGTGGPSLSNITNFVINWDLPNKGLWQFSMNTNNGVPTWWLNFLPLISHTFGVPSPACKITGSGIPAMDGEYWATVDGPNFVLVAKSGAYAIYFTNGAAPSGCPVKSAQDEMTNEPAVPNSFVMFPNPIDKGASLWINLKWVMDGASFSISDLSGKSMITGKLNEVENCIDLKGILNSGIYVVRISNGNEPLTQKLIIF